MPAFELRSDSYHWRPFDWVDDVTDTSHESQELMDKIARVQWIL